MNTRKIEPGIKRLACEILGWWKVGEVARRTGALTSQAVYSWKDSGNVPLVWRPEVLRMCREDGKELKPLERVYLQSTEKVPTIRNLVDCLAVEGPADVV